ncbi:MAG: DUF2997 domain-containing protein [Dehalococcoidia bacterium]|nr:DUF2997 domain-containing protein [Dehalococcoidia bacterium]
MVDIQGTLSDEAAADDKEVNVAEIIITVTPDGKPKVEVKGVKGRKCLDLSRAIEEALGQATETKRTKEFYESADTGNRQEVKG